ncbi:hypothetical protein J2848_005771 [Azospirillum lipoferum]|uniref:Uncharacterized protein n=1 Tax=Azospirillum lipoferum TaxID=193 RepID=A0A5A9GET2_AZOLI|nr:MULTISPECIES: hypothetical protein [Azospirillum]KAA0592886.1 hypothetical protein FZ942_25465 [Azospirillum lipoferum]MCP1614070.1 hypothetical protein [Azospirillum lipoferum]MDW5537540.1 hypothetical protein [Azospirillum sp. NL1]
MIHKILDAIDTVVAEKRQNGQLEDWLKSGAARRFCEKISSERKHYYPALLLYLERSGGKHV